MIAYDSDWEGVRGSNAIDRKGVDESRRGKWECKGVGKSKARRGKRESATHPHLLFDTIFRKSAGQICLRGDSEEGGHRCQSHH